MAGKLWVTAIAAAVVTLSSFDPAAAQDCFAGLGAALQRGGYSPGVDCSRIEQTVKYVGHTRPWRGHSYYVYQLSWRDKPKGFGVQHGGARILIFDSRRRYLGFYGGFERGKYRHLRIVGSDVVFAVSPKKGDRIRLRRARPPDDVWIDEDVIGFGR